jgi:hypothetical protein
MKHKTVQQLLLIGVAILNLTGCKPEAHTEAVPKETVIAAPPVDDAFWLNLDRRRVEIYKAQLRDAPQILLVRETHYNFNPTNGIGMHYGWIDGRIANLHISFSELVGFAYSNNYARTDFPDKWTHGQWTNRYDVIATVTNQPQTALAATCRDFLRQQYGLSWHWKDKESDVLLLRTTDPSLLQSKVTTDFANSRSVSELTPSLENYFGKPVVDETGAASRYDKSIDLVPARWVNGRTTDLAVNNRFLATFGLELVPAKRPQKWLVLD